MKKMILIILLFTFLLTFAQNQEWVARYNGPGNGEDRARAIAVDNNGNVYVTGYSVGPGTFYDYATIKYAPNGQEVWVSRYDGSVSSRDEATAIAVDNNGNVYVTGFCYDSVTSSDYSSNYVTIKYDPNGQEVWVSRYNGPDNGYDYATAIAVDNNGNVYVTGASELDYATIKYNQNGQVVWVARYNGPGNGDDWANAIAVDDNGNVYVTGYSRGSGTELDYATIKYNSNGQEVWVSRYNGPGNRYDEATAIAVDNNGNVYVTGASWGGWDTYYDYATIKYNSNGEVVWVARYNGPGNGNDRANAIAVDSYGNVYVTGVSYGSGISYDYVTIKYNQNGQEVWVSRYNGPGNGRDEARAIAVDNNGNVYVTGESKGLGTDFDYATIKYNPNGEEIWVSRYNGPGDSSDRARAIAVDNYGNVYVTGESYGSGTDFDYATIKYSSVGIEESKSVIRNPFAVNLKNLKIYNPLGKIVNKSLKELKAGVYFLETKEKKEKRKIIIMK